MLTTDRDCQKGGERFAVPTLGEIEGKLLVFEVVATSCLREILAHPQGGSISLIRRTITDELRRRCKDAGLSRDNTADAVRYGLQVLDAAVQQAGKGS